MDKRDELQEKWSNLYVNSSQKEVLDLAPRVGKIRTSILILNKIGIKGNVLIAYPDNSIKESWEKDFVKFNYNNKNVTFTNFSSLEKHIYKRYDMFIIDEIHELSEREYIKASYICNNAERVLGLSGTLSDSTKYAMGAFLNLQVLVKYSLDDAIRDNIIADYLIKVHIIKLDNKEVTKNSKGIFKTEKSKYDSFTFVIDKFKKEKKDSSFLVLSRYRLVQSSIGKLNKVKSLVKSLENKRFLVFTGLQKTCESLGIPFYHSKCKTADALNDFINQKINSLSLVKIGGIGVTYPALDCIILSNFTFNEEKTEQMLARALVLDYKTKIANIHIISTNEDIEIRKLQETLKNLDPSKITYHYFQE